MSWANQQITHLHDKCRRLEARADKAEKKITAIFEFLDSLPFSAEGVVTVTREGIRDLDTELTDIEYDPNAEDDG